MAYKGTASPQDIAEDFGQKVDLTRRIREILANYPEGTTVLKELIQNADDAGATEVSFCLDRRKHGADSMLYEGLSPWQGPAVLAFNNAEFSAEDFESISKLGGSKKGREPWKTGRFGVGFNSVYHLSDLPSFVSGRHIVYFDPHCKFLPNISSVNPGKRIDFVKSSALSYYKDQFTPYCMFGCDMKAHFQGTIFRFPLRTVRQAAESQLSKQHYKEENIIQLFDELCEEASLCMLFLKNVEVIKFYDWYPDNSSPFMLCSCSLTSLTSQTRWQRHALTRLADSWTSFQGNASKLKYLESFILEFNTEKSFGNKCRETFTESFMIVQCMDTPISQVGILSSLAAKEYGVCLLPWVAVAAKISGTETQVSSGMINDGKAFCFLPLPLRTNLPVHVNGFFELSSNRRDIWHGADMDGMGKIRASWNTLLLNDVITSAYYHLLMNAPEDARLNYTFWPSETFSEPWKSMVDSFYEGLSKYPVLHSDIDGGRWLTLPQSVLHDYQMPNFEKQASILLALGLPLVCMPHRLFQIVSNHCDAKIMCPNLLRQHLKHVDVNQCGNHLQWESGLDFLDYCLGDVLDEDAARDLSGIPLVPLANGKFGVFGDKDCTFSYLLCNEKQYFLLEKVNHMIVSRNIPQVLLQRIHQMTELSSVNISFMNITGFVNLLDKILPAEWKGKDVVKWIPEGQNHHPSRAWLTAFWEYLNDYNEDLNFLGSWPLIPANEGLLCSAKRGLGIIRGDGSLSKDLEHILIDIGCHIMRSDICIGHSWLSKCVQSPTAMGVLDAISCVVLNKGHAYKDALLSINPEQRRELRSFLLDEKWYRGNLMKEPHLHILRSLPVFEAYDKNRDEKCFIDLQNSKLYFPPPNVDVSLLGADFLHTESQMEIEVLSKSLGIRQMERAAFYKLAVIGKITALLPVIRDQAMLSILKELPFLCLEDPDFKNSLISLSFVPTPSGDLQPPRCLYDPRIKEFQVLLDGKQSFPSDAFRKHDVLDALQMLGLQTSVSPNTILESARQVEYMLKDLPDEACIRGFFLLSYLEANAVKLFPSSISDGFNSMLLKVGDIFQTRKAETDVSRRFWSELASICWCPVLVQPPHPGLPWPSVTAPLAPPRLVRLPADLWLVSASMRILNGDCRSAFLSEKLGWTSHLGGNVLAAQLLELGRNQAYAGSQGLKQALATVIPRMYALLSEKIGTEEIEIVKTVLEGSEWVWVGDKFVCVHDVVLSGPLHLAPYLWVVPADLAVFKELLVELGVKESLTVWDYSNLLSKIAKVKSNISLDSLELKTVIWILQHLTDLGFAQKETGLFVPDTNGILLPSSELVYNDAPWLLGDPQEGGSALDSVIGSKSLPNFVHANISNDVAEKLNIRSLRRLVLSESADSLNLTLHGAAEAFGQHEALTTRLKHIVDMYVDGPGILCELLQNSDDAGASEVSFLLDLTYYGTSSLLAPRMAEWQGPALYCFNNAVFTSKDLHAISRIGQDSKIDKPHAVGRFGLGFNSVYHFTDLPAFVSGNSLVIFDPHACHLPGISPSHPGLKINYVGKGLVQQFPDQCHPYTLFGCDLQHFYNGTLFRFPLRSSSAASRSQIKQMAYTPEMVFSLFQDFQIVASEVLLFLHNVTNITLYSKEGLDHEMCMLYKVSKRCDAQKNSVYTFVRSLKEKSKNKDDFYKNLKDIRDDSLPSDCQLIHITTDEAKRRYTQSWIVSEYLGGKQAVRMATRSENRIHGFVPWAGIAAKMGAEVNSCSSSSGSLEIQSIPSCFKSIPVEGRAFCFLPLPVKTGLPVHVNAYFELSSNRRDIWFGDDMAGGGKLRSEWNQCLLKEVASSAYVRMLAWAARESGSSEDYYFLWPTNMLSEPWAALSSGIYVLAAEMDLPLLFTNANSGRWIPPSKAIFPDFSYSQMMELGSALTDARLSLVNTPTSLVDQFKKNCPTLRYLTPQLLRSLLIRCPNAMQGREAALAALRYCLSDIQTVESLEKLEGLPLLPLANGAFETFTCLSTSEKVFFADKLEFDLLKDTKLDRLVDRCLGPELLEGLHAIAEFESTNIALLSPVLLKELLPDILPQDWYGKSLVHWTTMAESGHPTRSWIELLWKFLCLHSADLSLFAEWPLLPTQDEHHLLQPIKGSCILMSENWSENMVSLIKKANCYLLSSSVHIDHPQLRDYVHDVSASGLLGAFFAAAGGFEGLQDILKHISELEMQELRGFLMQRRWFVDGSMNAFHVEILKHLPIFKTFKTSGYVSLMKGIKFIPPKDVDVHLLGNEFICAGSDKEEEILTNYLGIKKLEKSEFFTNYDFENLRSIQPGLQEKVILNLLQDFRLLEKEVPCIREVLSKVAIIPTAHGELKSPKELYDPRVLELHSLLGDSFFPSSVFSVVNVLDVLLDLGLKTSLGLEDLLDSAISVAARSLIDENHALNMGKCLLAHINKLGLSLEMSAANRVINEFNFDSEAYVLHQEEKSSNEEGVCLEDFEKPQEPDHTLSNEGTERQFWLKLRDIKWCPALNKAPHLFLPWPREPKSLLVPPIVVRPKSQMWHVSSTMCILDGEFNSRLMMSRLGWLEKPNLTVLAMQVIELSRHHTDIQSQSSFESTTEETNAGIEQFNKILDEVVPSIYRLMEERLTSDNVIILKSMFENVCWVWVGDAFVSPQQAAFISPSHFQPYLHTIPANLSVFRALLSVMGVKDTFDVLDFAHVLEQVSNDRQGKALTKELLDFVIRMLEAIDDILSMDDTVADQRLLSTILVPNATGFLMPAKDLIYNDAPWLTQSVHGRADIKYFVHPDVPNGLVDKLGAKSLRYLSFVDKEMTKDLPCLVLPDILTVLSKCGGKLNLLFDLLEIADKCKAKKMHVLYDKRVHSQISILQPNLGQYQGPALTVAFEGAELTTEEVCNLQLSPSWSRRGHHNNYGAGLLSCYTIADILLLVSKGCLYIFDPSGTILASSFTSGKSSAIRSAQGKVYTLEGTDIPQKFADQFAPLRITEDIFWGTPNITIFRMPLYTDGASCEEGKDMRNQSSESTVDSILRHFISSASTSLLFLNTIEEVQILRWESKDSGSREVFSVRVDPACAALRNPFMQRNTKKFQLSAIFNSSATATKVRTIDVLVNEDGNCIIDKWLVILSFGYGQTKTLALDRRFLAYNLSPVAGVAVLVSRNGLQSSLLHKSVVLCPLPLSICFGLPVAILGCFIVSHDGNRHLFQSSSEAFSTHSIWNQELMACVCESYVYLLNECMHPEYEASSMSLYRSSSEIPPAARRILSKQSYILWPTPQKLRLASLEVEEMSRENLETNWLLKYLIRPMIVRLADLPVWKLHGGYFARATEGMFLSNPNTELNSFQLPDAVCEFLKEHYKVFAVPYELTEALQDAQVRIKIITPRMIRYLLRTSPAVPKFSGVDNYVELLDYSCSDFGSVLEEKVAIAESSGTSAIHGDVKYSDASVMSPGEELSLLRDQGSAELPLLGREPSAIMNNFRRAMTQIGKTVEELSIEASQRFITQRQVSEASQQSDSSNNLDKWINEVKGLPCPAANNSVHRIGRIELLLGSTEQQELLVPLSAKFIHTKCMDRPLLSRIFENSSVQSALKIKPFTANVLSDSMALVLPREWCEGAFHWVEWNKNARLKSPTVEWLLLFWKHVFVLTDNLTLFQQWPLVPASLGIEILVKLQYSHLIFMPPLLESDIESRMSTAGSIEEHIETRPSRAIERSYAKVKENHPWLIPFLQYCNVPVFDENFIDSNVVKTCCPTEGQTLCHLVRSKLLAAKESGNLVASQMKVMSSDCDALFSLFAEECNSAASVSSNFTTTEIEFMRSLPIYRTVLGSYTSLDLSIHCIVAPTAFFKPQSDLCLQYYAPEEGGAYYNKLGVQELSDSEILVKFCLPFFGALTTEDQEQTLAHVYAHWESLQYNDGVLNALTHTRFVRNKSGEDGVLFQPHELLDPTVSLFKEVFKERPERFPDTKFMSNRWLAILRKAGLHSTLDAESLLGCAKEVENMGRWGLFSDLQSDNFKEISEETFIIAGKVVEAILANLAALYGSSFFQPLSEIAFVPTAMGIPSRYGNAGTRVLSCYKQLVLLKDWPLAWTSSPILTNPNLVPPEFSWHSLQLKSPPQLPVVLKHIQNVGIHDGEDILARWPSSHDMMRVEDAFLDILKYLERQWENLSNQDKLLLKNVPFIPVSNGTRLCLPRRVFLRLEMNLAPFMFQLPNCYLPFVNILTELGMQETPKFIDLQDLLYQLQTVYGYQSLNPNEICAVLRILDFMCKNMENEDQEHLIKGGAIVPDNGRRLVHAQSCVYVDPPGRAMLDKIDVSRLRFVHPEIDVNHCILLGVQKLSEIIVEVLDDSFALEYTEYFGNINKEDIVSRLKSESFQHAAWTLVQDFSNEMPNLKPFPKYEVIEKLLWSAQHLECVKQLKTQFIMLKSNVDVTKVTITDDNSGSEVDHFNYVFVDTKNDKLMLAQPRNFLLIPEILSLMMSKVLDSPVFLPLSGLFKVPVGTEILHAAMLRLRPCQVKDMRLRVSKHQAIIPGDELSKIDSLQVQVHPLRAYYSGEIVAWCSDLASLSNLKYGMIVEDARAPSGQAMYYLRVETYPGQIEQLLSSNVFSFKSALVGDEIQPLSRQLPLTSKPENSVKGQVIQPYQDSKKVQKNAEVFVKNVQASTVVNAVNDMMSAVGLPLGMDQQTLLTEALTLQERLAAAQEALASESERASNAVKEAEAARALWVCRICLTLEVNSVLVPCGHVMCRSCCSSVARCPFCRQLVTMVVNLYRP